MATLIVAAIAIVVLSTIFIPRACKPPSKPAWRSSQVRRSKRSRSSCATPTLPLHDTSVEKAVIRARMASISQDMARLDGEAAAMAFYALGRGHLALQRNTKKALEYLRLAHKVACALPPSSTPWDARWVSFTTSSSKSAATQRQALPGVQSQDRSRSAQSRPAPPASERWRARRVAALAEGLLAYYSQQFEEALKKGQEALTAEPLALRSQEAAGRRLLRLRSPQPEQRSVSESAQRLSQRRRALSRCCRDGAQRLQHPQRRGRYLGADHGARQDPGPVAERGVRARARSLRSRHRVVFGKRQRGA